MGAKILIVEDNANIRDILKFSLTRRGHTVFCCANSLEVDNVLKEQIPDCFILDIMLPYKTGIEILEEIRKDRRFDNSAVIFLSAITRDTDKNPEYFVEKFKVDAFFDKPFKVRELVEKVEQLLEQKQKVQEKK